LYLQITYELVYKADRDALNLNSNIEVLRVNERVKTYVTNEDTFTEEIKEEEPAEVKYDRKLSYRSSISECEDNFEPEIDLDDITDDEKPLIHLNNKLEPDIPCSPTTVFVDNKKEIITLPNESVKEIKDTIITITPKAKKYKFVSTKKHARFLDANHWNKFNLSEEDAIKEFRAKAENRTYKASPFKCTDCFKGFSKKEMLNRHIQRRHSEVSYLNYFSYNSH
jgi:hypothetical protein